MHNVIIADDEPLVIQSLLASVDWEALYCRVIKTFSNSKDAYDFILCNPVDIVIADISMPPFSGLCLCSSVLEYDRRIQFIIISGYADFSYAKKAIQIGVVGYCLKPIDYNEITLLIKKACKRLNPPKYDFSGSFIESIYESNYAKVKEHLAQIGFYDNLYLAVSVGKRSASQFILIPHYTMQIASNRYLYLSSENMYKNIDKESLFSEGKILGIGGSGQYVSIKNLKDKIEFAAALAYSYFISPNHKIFFKTPEKQCKQFAEINNNIRNPNLLKILLTGMKNSEVQNTLTIRDAIKIHNTILNAYYNLQQDDEDHNVYSYDQIISEYGNFKAMLESLCEVLDDSHQGFVKEGDSSNNKNFLDMMKYINENFTKDISIKSIADTLHLNSNYISQLFKRETGVTYSSYIITLRINYAKELLAQPEVTITEACEQSGYNDYFYFIKSFKKATGMTPGDYKCSISG